MARLLPDCFAQGVQILGQLHKSFGKGISLGQSDGARGKIRWGLCHAVQPIEEPVEKVADIVVAGNQRAFKGIEACLEGFRLREIRACIARAP